MKSATATTHELRFSKTAVNGGHVYLHRQLAEELGYFKFSGQPLRICVPAAQGNERLYDAWYRGRVACDRLYVGGVRQMVQDLAILPRDKLVVRVVGWHALVVDRVVRAPLMQQLPAHIKQPLWQPTCPSDVEHYFVRSAAAAEFSYVGRSEQDDQAVFYHEATDSNLTLKFSIEAAPESGVLNVAWTGTRGFVPGVIILGPSS